MAEGSEDRQQTKAKIKDEELLAELGRIARDKERLRYVLRILNVQGFLQSHHRIHTLPTQPVREEAATKQLQLDLEEQRAREVQRHEEEKERAHRDEVSAQY